MKKVYIIAMLLAFLLPSVAVESLTDRTVARVASQPESDSVKISAYDNRIRVQNAPVGSVLEVYSVIGIKVKEIRLKEPDGEYPVNIPKGYYIIRIGETVRKVVIR